MACMKAQSPRACIFHKLMHSRPDAGCKTLLSKFKVFLERERDDVNLSVRIFHLDHSHVILYFHIFTSQSPFNQALRSRRSNADPCLKSRNENQITMICAIRLTHANLSTFHNNLNNYNNIIIKVIVVASLMDNKVRSFLDLVMTQRQFAW